MIKYLSTIQVIEIHDFLIKKYGGRSGIMSQNLLESAVFRMQVTFNGVDLYENPFEKAAALLESLCKNHAFVDGNKRTGFVACMTFLDLNGYSSVFDTRKTEEFLVQIASSKKVPFQKIVQFLEKASIKRK